MRLPEPVDAAALLSRAREEGIAYLPGSYFAVSRQATANGGWPNIRIVLCLIVPAHLSRDWLKRAQKQAQDRREAETGC